MFWRFKWFGVCFSAFATGAMYEMACLEMEYGASMVHPLLVTCSIASAFAVMGGLSAVAKSGNQNLASGVWGVMMLWIALMFLMHPISGPMPTREAPYVFPSWGDYVLLGAIASNLTLALLMVFARVPKGKMLIVNDRAFYGGDRPVFLPWMKYNVEKFDEISVKVEFLCAAGTSVVCEAALAPEVEWCRMNGVVNVNTARVKAVAAEIVKSVIYNRTATLDTRWMCVGEVLDALASVDVATIKGAVEGVRFCCLCFTATASTTKTLLDAA